LGASRGQEKAFGNPNARPEASSFDRILKTTSADEKTGKPALMDDKTDKTVREQQVQRDPVPVQKGMQDRTPDRSSVEANRNEPRTAQKDNNSWDEPRSVKEKGQSEKVGNKTNSDSPNREQVMLEFMDSMESEFGIPPQRIVEAMTKIPTSEQLSSPEDSASQVIAQLNLNDDDSQKAMALYMGMLAQLKMAQDPGMSKGQMVAVGAAGAAGAALATAPLNSQQRRTMLNQSLDQMNSKFFMQGPSAMKPDTQAVKGFQSNVPQMQDVNPLQDAMPKDQVAFGQNPQAEKLPAFMRGKESIPKSNAELANMQQQMQGMDPNSPEAKALLKSLAALSASAAALDQGLKSDPQNMKALKAEQMLGGANGANAAGTAGAAGAAAGLSGMAALGLGGADDEDTDDMGGEGSSPDQQFMVSQPQPHHLQHMQGDGINSPNSFGAVMAGAGMENRAANPAEHEANVQQMMKQAQYLIKKGGGEAKIQMAPEGIGQVHMKMTVLDGKVNLEMQAETKEAKKLIESSIGDLKTHLAHHQLAVDQVKVDVGNQTSTDARNQDSNKQQQMDARQDQSKQQARDFWSEFNGSNTGGFERRSGFMDSPGIRAYGSNRREAAIPASTSVTPSAKREAGSGKGRGLDLVA
jgi:flagellar hook-length control protein FliK